MGYPVDNGSVAGPLCEGPEASRPGLKELLLGPGPRFENLIPKRRRFKRRKAVVFQ